MGRLLARSPLGPNGLPVAKKRQLCQGSGCFSPDSGGKAVSALLGCDRLVVAVVDDDDVHTWLGHVCTSIERTQPTDPHTGALHLHTHNLLLRKKKPWATNTANLSRPKSWTTSATVLSLNREEVVDNVSCVTCLAGACDHCFAWAVSQVTLPQEQARSDTAVDETCCMPAISNLVGNVERNSGHAQTLFVGPWSLSIKNVVIVNMSKTGL